MKGSKNIMGITGYTDSLHSSRNVLSLMSAGRYEDVLNTISITSLNGAGLSYHMVYDMIMTNVKQLDLFEGTPIAEKLMILAMRLDTHRQRGPEVSNIGILMNNVYFTKAYARIRDIAIGMSMEEIEAKVLDFDLHHYRIMRMAHPHIARTVVELIVRKYVRYTDSYEYLSLDLYSYWRNDISIHSDEYKEIRDSIVRHYSSEIISHNVDKTIEDADPDDFHRRCPSKSHIRVDMKKIAVTILNGIEAHLNYENHYTVSPVKLIQFDDGLYSKIPSIVELVVSDIEDNEYRYDGKVYNDVLTLNMVETCVSSNKHISMLLDPTSLLSILIDIYRHDVTPHEVLDVLMDLISDSVTDITTFDKDDPSTYRHFGALLVDNNETKVELIRCIKSKFKEWHLYDIQDSITDILDKVHKHNK